MDSKDIVNTINNAPATTGDMSTKIDLSGSITGLQKAINQIGMEAVHKSIPLGSKIGICDLHGAYMVHSSSEMVCPICPNTPPANGPTATEVEHYIDMQPIQGTNPGQKLNPYGV